MTSRYLLLTGLALLLAAPQSARSQTFFTAQLTEAQAGVEVEGTAVGTAALVLTDEGLRYYVTVDGLSGGISAAHFHQGATGVSGGVVHPITFDGNRAEGTWPASGDGAMTDELRMALLTGDLYINVHTEANPAGEIRGQVLPSSGTSFGATLSAAQETGDITSDGSGTAAVQLTEAGAIYYVTVDGLSGDISAAHFHLSPIGTSGGVVREITFEGNTAIGLWTADDAQPLADSMRVHMLLGNLYLNVHTANNPAGEIRGQVLPNGGIGMGAILNAENETGEITSDGVGTGTFTLTEDGLIYDVTVTGLTGPIQAAHFHQAAAGTDGGVVRAITFEGNSARGVWRPSDGQPLTDELIQALLAGEIYVNVHTTANAAGEIRGQVLMGSSSHFSARLTPEAEEADIASDGSGTASADLTAEGLAYNVTVDGLTGPPSAAHFHLGPIGVSGGVVHPITFDGNSATGVWATGDMPDSLFEALMVGDLYLNVHTAANPAGEIRGQVLLSSGAGIKALLTNEQQAAEVTQDGSGTGTFTLTDDGLVYHATVTGLSGPINAAHFHDAPAGANSGVVRGVTFEGASTKGVWRPTDGQALTDSLLTAVATGGIYLNVHTTANPAGEIRGQLELAGGIGRAVEMDPQSEGGDITSDGHGTASATLTGAGMVFHATVSELTGPIQAAHFHQAPLGTNGGVVRPVTFDGQNLAGIWRAVDADPLDASKMVAFFADELYLNVHTQSNPGGEVRGQLDRVENVATTAAEPVGEGVPGAFALDQNYPNPFNPSTTIRFDLRESGHATLEVFDVLGRRVALLHDGPLAAGSYSVQFDGSRFASGVYAYRLTAGDQHITRSMQLAK